LTELPSTSRQHEYKPGDSSSLGRSAGISLPTSPNGARAQTLDKHASAALAAYHRRESRNKNAKRSRATSAATPPILANPEVIERKGSSTYADLLGEDGHVINAKQDLEVPDFERHDYTRLASLTPISPAGDMQNSTSSFASPTGDSHSAPPPIPSRPPSTTPTPTHTMTASTTMKSAQLQPWWMQHTDSAASDDIGYGEVEC
jgi:hypothetical protein